MHCFGDTEMQTREFYSFVGVFHAWREMDTRISLKLVLNSTLFMQQKHRAFVYWRELETSPLSRAEAQRDTVHCPLTSI